MEPKSNVSTVQSAPWKQFFRFNGEARRGQSDLWNAVLKTEGPYLALLPTGYGKTLAACGTYVIARAQDRATRLLVLVPTDQQRTQWANGAKKNLARCGYTLRLGAYLISKEPRDLRYCEDGHAEVFVATYQQAHTDPQFWARLLGSGKWFVVFDECHHLHVDGRWGQETNEFDTAERLYLTATPMRHDGRTLIGVPRRTRDDGASELRPTVNVSYGEAVDEEAVRPVRVHVHHYFVDVQSPDGRVERLTTERMREEGVTDFADYETKYQLRYCEKYLSSILLDATRMLDARNILHPGQHQMLVFAMTCRHAEAVARALNGIMEPGFADWIGMTRRDQENEAVLSAYESNRLQCLVQVDKAGEGFDNVRCSVLVFLHLIKSATKNTQQIGRGLRRNESIPFESDECQVFASADSPMLDVARDLENAAELIVAEQSKEAREVSAREKSSNVATIPSVAVVSAQLDRVEIVCVGTSTPSVDMRRAAFAADWLRSKGVPDVEKMPASALINVADGIGEQQRAKSPASELFANESLKLDFWRSKVKQGAGLLARNVVQLRADADGERFERSLLGDTIRAIHSEWIRRSGNGHDAMTAEHLQKKYDWIRGVNEALKEGVVPPWIRV